MLPREAKDYKKLNRNTVAISEVKSKLKNFLTVHSVTDIAKNNKYSLMGGRDLVGLIDQPNLYAFDIAE